MIENHIVIGSSFGDEGKGKVVSYLCSKYKNPLVVRFSGGQQAAHHVVIKNKIQHVFSNFGSGTLQNAPTYWSKYCTVDPDGILNEFEILKELGFDPILYVDQNSPVTTPYEKLYNKIKDAENMHGSCGVGVGQTIQREEDHYSLLFKDIQFPSILKIKLELLEKYYNLKIDIDRFLDVCEDLDHNSNIRMVDNIDDVIEFLNPDSLIFEGSQGLLLDQKYGFFPHVTRSNTGSKNVIDMGYEPEVWLITRAYQTRHGNGPMTNVNITPKIEYNPYEKNDWSPFQGNFRRSILDLDLLKYSISIDPYFKTHKINLVITCIDLLIEFSYTVRGKKQIENNENDFIEKIKNELYVENVFISRTPYPELEKYSSN